jgi:hypothetical protein
LRPEADLATLRARQHPDRWRRPAAKRLSACTYAPLDVVFSDVDVVEPDLLYLSNARTARC